MSINHFQGISVLVVAAGGRGMLGKLFDGDLMVFSIFDEILDDSLRFMDLPNYDVLGIVVELGIFGLYIPTVAT